MAKKKSESKVEFRDRIVELRRVRASELMNNALNWKIHGQHQKDAMKAILGDIGYTSALVARMDSSGQLVLLDGHMRAGISPNQELPVLIVDLSEDEANKMLATFDPVSTMADVDNKALQSLVASIPKMDDALRGLIDSVMREEEAIVGALEEELSTYESLHHDTATVGGFADVESQVAHDSAPDEGKAPETAEQATQDAKKKDAVSETGEDSKESGLPSKQDEATAGPPPKDDRLLSPVLIELTRAELRKWKDLKKSIEIKDNTAAFKHFVGI